MGSTFYGPVRLADGQPIYTLIPHPKTDDYAALAALARTTYEKPLVGTAEDESGALGGRYEFMRIDSDGALLFSFRAVDGGLELRLCDLSGKGAAAKVALDFPLKEATKMDMIGKKIAAEEIGGNSFTAKLDPWDIAAYLLR